MKERAKMKEDDGEFLYCLPRQRKNPRARYDPFDLQVVSPNEAQKSDQYYTISASFITRVNLFVASKKIFNKSVKMYIPLTGISSLKKTPIFRECTYVCMSCLIDFDHKIGYLVHA